jgi:3'-phosphoadenosine 5'-phosphosulfate sulfotransferase (PAPS reductase)/FAD synthetase
MDRETTKTIQGLRDRGAVFYISHSGGKDSQCQTIELKKLVPADQLVIINSHLPEVEWSDIDIQIEMTTMGLQKIWVQAGKTFFEMVDNRKMWPAPKYRQCTSDLKRDPINKAIRADLKSKGKSLAVVCMGIRAEESPARAKAKTFKINKRLSTAGREVYDLLPIHGYKVEEVFQTIEDAGEEPHWVYSKGMTRLSCCFCIMASKKDLQTAAGLSPKLYKKYVEKEREINHTMRAGKTLEEQTGFYLEPQLELFKAA